MVTGIPASSQKLEVFDLKDKLVLELQNDDDKLGKFEIDDHYRIHVTSKDGSGGMGSGLGTAASAGLGVSAGAGYGGIIDFNDTSKVEKYELDEEKYDNLKGTVRDYKRRMKMGRFNAEEVAKQEAEKLEQTI